MYKLNFSGFAVALFGFLTVTLGCGKNNEVAKVDPHESKATSAMSDAGGDEQKFGLGIGIPNQAPVAIALSSGSIKENLAIGTTIGVLSTTDPDVSDFHTYTLSGVDAASFRLAGNGTASPQLQSNAFFDFETKSSYSIIIKSTDLQGLSFSQAFTITIIDVLDGPTVPNSVPTGITLTSIAIDPRALGAVAVGTLKTIDKDIGQTHTYSLSGTQAGFFTVDGSTLKILSRPRVLPQTYSVTITTIDNLGGRFSKAFSIVVK